MTHFRTEYFLKSFWVIKSQSLMSNDRTITTNVFFFVAAMALLKTLRKNNYYQNKLFVYSLRRQTLRYDYQWCFRFEEKKSLFVEWFDIVSRLQQRKRFVYKCGAHYVESIQLLWDCYEVKPTETASKKSLTNCFSKSVVCSIELLRVFFFFWKCKVSNIYCFREVQAEGREFPVWIRIILLNTNAGVTMTNPIQI